MVKFLSISNTFNKKEIYSFKKYINLHYSQDSKVHLVSEWILNESKPRNYKTIDEIHVAFPEKLKKQSFKNLISELGNVAEEFIAWQHWKANEKMKNTSKLISLAERNLDKCFLKLSKKISEKDKNESIDIFSDYYRTISLFYEYNFQISDSKDNYIGLFKELISTFKTGVAKIAQTLLVEIRNRESLIESEDWANEMEFFDLLYENPTDIIQIMNQLLLLNNEKDNSAYIELITILKKPESNKLSHFLRYSILIYCTVYLHGLFKTGKHERVNELLELYEYGLSNKILTPNDSIDTRTYLNVISVFSKLSSSEKTLELINKYTAKVDYSDYHVIKQIAISTLDFNKGRFEKVIEELRTLEPMGFHLKFKTRWLQLKSLLEVQTEYTGVIIGLISSFKRYVISNKGSFNKPTYDGLIATIRIISMIIDKKSISEIEKSISNSTNIFEQKWVLNYIDRSDF